MNGLLPERLTPLQLAEAPILSRFQSRPFRFLAFFCLISFFSLFAESHSAPPLGRRSTNRMALSRWYFAFFCAPLCETHAGREYRQATLFMCLLKETPKKWTFLTFLFLTSTSCRKTPPSLHSSFLNPPNRSCCLEKRLTPRRKLPPPLRNLED